jgi:hypothetical protein
MNERATNAIATFGLQVHASSMCRIITSFANRNYYKYAKIV